MPAPPEPVSPNALVSLRLVELVNAADPCALAKSDISPADPNPNSQLSITLDFSGTTLDIVTFVVLVVLVDMSVTPVCVDLIVELDQPKRVLEALVSEVVPILLVILASFACKLPLALAASDLSPICRRTNPSRASIMPNINLPPRFSGTRPPKYTSVYP